MKVYTHGTRDRANSPAQSVQVIPRPFCAVDLFGKLGRQNHLRIVDVQVGQIHQ